jgi:hypothetical protein
MTNGNETAAAVKKISIEINASVGQIMFGVGGKTLTFHSERALGTRDMAALFGWSRKISNAAALSRDTTTGLPATDAEKFDAMAEMIRHLETGTTEWNTRSTAGRGGSADMALLIAALMELKPNASKDELTAQVKAWTPADRAALMLNAKVKPIVDRLRSAVAQNVDADELLSELGI